MNTRIALESLSMDLMRVAISCHRGADRVIERFTKEALIRSREVQQEEVKPYLWKYLTKLEGALTIADKASRADELLLHSILIQNYLKRF